MIHSLRAQRKQAAPLWPISIGRVLIGVLWLFTLRWKLPPSFASADGRGLLDWLQLEVQHPTIAIYGDFVQSIVIPNFAVFAWLIFLAELGVGVALLTGMLARPAAALGLLMSLNLGIGLSAVPGEWPWSYLMMAMWHGLFVIAAPGRLWGVDLWLRRRWPRARWLALT